MTDSNLMNGFKKLMDANPPEEPTQENPGLLVRMLMEYESEFMDGEGREPTPSELLTALAMGLDHIRYRERLAEYNRMKARFGRVFLEEKADEEESS